MHKGRLEAFSDGVLAIIITIMVLTIKLPEGNSWAALKPLFPVVLSYALSFLYIGIYWNNHHHLLHTCHKVTGGILWANLNLLFWLSLLPLATGWVGQTNYAPAPSCVYGGILLLAAISYWILQQAMLKAEGPNGLLAKAIGRDWKGNLSPVLYVIAIVSTGHVSWLSQSIYVLVALLWVIPDKRIEKVLKNEANR